MPRRDFMKRGGFFFQGETDERGHDFGAASVTFRRRRGNPTYPPCLKTSVFKAAFLNIGKNCQISSQIWQPVDLRGEPVHPGSELVDPNREPVRKK